MERSRGKKYISSRRVNSRHDRSVSKSNAIEEDIVKIKSENINTIGQSGNSDVDVKIDVFVDTTAIAFAILTSLLATKQMTNEEFEIAVRRLENLTQGRDSDSSLLIPNNVSNVKLYNNNGRRVD
ncbi:hypothetical protein K0H71_05705 [Bacillus sp. IITD106]|nr:hypothetical protein [Bacillus sp. IITD106]